MPHCRVIATPCDHPENIPHTQPTSPSLQCPTWDFKAPPRHSSRLTCFNAWMMSSFVDFPSILPVSPWFSPLASCAPVSTHGSGAPQLAAMAVSASFSPLMGWAAGPRSFAVAAFMAAGLAVEFVAGFSAIPGPPAMARARGLAACCSMAPAIDGNFWAKRGGGW